MVNNHYFVKNNVEYETKNYYRWNQQKTFWSHSSGKLQRYNTIKTTINHGNGDKTPLRQENKT